MNNIGQELQNKVIIIKASVMREELRADPAMRAFLCIDGFGCHSFTSGSTIHGKLLRTGETTNIRGDIVESLATKEVYDAYNIPFTE